MRISITIILFVLLAVPAAYMHIEWFVCGFFCLLKSSYLEINISVVISENPPYVMLAKVFPAEDHVTLCSRLHSLLVFPQKIQRVNGINVTFRKRLPHNVSLSIQQPCKSIKWLAFFLPCTFYSSIIFVIFHRSFKVSLPLTWSIFDFAEIYDAIPDRL